MQILRRCEFIRTPEFIRTFNSLCTISGSGINVRINSHLRRTSEFVGPTRRAASVGLIGVTPAACAGVEAALALLAAARFGVHAFIVGMLSSSSDKRRCFPARRRPRRACPVAACARAPRFSRASCEAHHTQTVADVERDQGRRSPRIWHGPCPEFSREPDQRGRSQRHERILDRIDQPQPPRARR